MKALILRLDALQMSFGGVLVDQHGFIERFPGTALLTGLLANAMGWRHGDFEHLQSLQNRLQYAARWDVKPTRIVDYHTVDLGQPKMKGYATGKEPLGWTTRGIPNGRGKGEATKGTHIRYRHYWADGLMTIALSLLPGNEPNLDRLHQALIKPVRPLFLGRKACLPSRPLLDPQPRREGPDMRTILRKVPRWDRTGQVAGNADDCEACWPAPQNAASVPEHAHAVEVYDLRDWTNQLPAGSQQRIEGRLGG